MRQKYKLKPEAWDAIKSKLKLYKASHVVSPYTLENLSEEEEEAIVDTAISDHLDTKGNKFVKSYEKQFKARANKAIATLENFKYQLAMIEEAIQGHRPLQVNYTPKKQENNDSAHYFISDIHIGKLDTQ